MLHTCFTPFPILTTERILLRNMQLADAPVLQQLRSNPEVMAFINRPLIKTLQEAEAWVQMIIDAHTENKGITWSICLSSTPGNKIGNVGLWRIDKENHRGELGYMLLPEYQRKGFMTEALKAVVDYGFRVLDLHTIEAQIDPRNGASAAILDKLGFAREAYFRENYFLHGQFADTAVYSLINPFHAKNVASRPDAEVADSALIAL